MEKIDQKIVAKSGWKAESIPFMQVAIYVMVGGGFLGRSAAEQPADFYLDERLKPGPYKDKEILQAVATLATLATANGLDPHHLPAMPNFHNCGIW
jgi:hypothetical protein